MDVSSTIISLLLLLFTLFRLFTLFVLLRVFKALFIFDTLEEDVDIIELLFLLDLPELVTRV